MIAYEAKKPLDISYPAKGENGGHSNRSDFYLEEGDLVFLEPGYWGAVEERDLRGVRLTGIDYEERFVLKKIAYKATKAKRDESGRIDFYKEWEEHDNINLFNPLIDKRYTIQEALERGMIEESMSWKREEKLRELGI